MRRYWVQKENLKDRIVELNGDLFQHICGVCRRNLGDRFEVICDGQAYLVEIREMERKKAMAVVIEKRQIKALARPHLHLALSLPRFQTLERVLEKSVELGVHSFHPFHSDFSFMKARPGDLENKKQRWARIIQGATRQTGRGELMELTEIRSLEELLRQEGQKSSFFGLLAYEAFGEASSKDSGKVSSEPKLSLEQTLGQIPGGLDRIWIFIGSEGGFSPKDFGLFKNYNVLPVSLGSQVLRVETACVTLLSVLKYHLGQFD